MKDKINYNYKLLVLVCFSLISVSLAVTSNMIRQSSSADFADGEVENTDDSAWTSGRGSGERIQECVVDKQYSCYW
ncbi:MAG: hypothetical protein ACYSSI_11485 [Planctomycetota bacterium]